MESSILIVVVLAVNQFVVSADDETCEMRPVFSSRERSADFFSKPSWIVEGGLFFEEESVFLRPRHCPVRVRVDDDSTKLPPGLNNGSHTKGSNSKKNNHSSRKLKGSKRKRKKEKRKRFRKKKKSFQKSSTQK